MKRFFAVIMVSLLVLPVFASGFVADFSAGDSFSFNKEVTGENPASLVANEVRFDLNAGYAFSRSFALLADFEYAFSVASFKGADGSMLGPYSFFAGGVLGRYRNSSFSVDFGGGIGTKTGTAADQSNKLFWFVKVVPAFELIRIADGNAGLDITIPFEYRRTEYNSFSVGVGARIALKSGMR